jgi:uncharacterized ion transporter superfamily protein YfcC
LQPSHNPGTWPPDYLGTATTLVQAVTLVTCHRPWEGGKILAAVSQGWGNSMMTLLFLMLIIVVCFIAGTMATHAEQSHMDQMADFVRKAAK